MPDTYSLIILFTLAVILSFIYNLISKRTHIPSVLMLIVTGILIQPVMKMIGLEEVDLFPVLELLGVVGIIFIVLEAALELEISRSKFPMIIRALLVSAISLGACAFLFAGIIILFFPAGLQQALLYAVPLSTISSAIVLPSVNKMIECDKEFLIYESTFSDILGIMFFFLLLEIKGSLSFGMLATYLGINVLLTILISVALSIVLAWLFQKIQSKVKLLLMVSVLILLYAVGKTFHISSLMLILFFGLLLQNYKIIRISFLKKLFVEEVMDELVEDLQVITFEISFVVRTFFFLVFGLTVAISGIADFQVILISLLILVGMYGLRFIILAIFSRQNIKSGLFVAPRGLITILLFFSIPEESELTVFSQDILLFVILLSGLIMAFTLIKQGIYSKKEEDLLPLTEKEIC